MPPPFKNYIYGTDDNDWLVGTGIRDVIYGYDGSDFLIGGANSDTYYGGLGDDYFAVQDAGDLVVENADEGKDTVLSYIANYTLGANVEDLYLFDGALNGTGNGLNNKIVGNDQNNVMAGLDGDDTLDGGLGADTMAGGLGDDTYHIDNVNDVAWETADQGNDTVVSSLETTWLAGNLENLILKEGSDAYYGVGNSLDNVFIGSTGDNKFSGQIGNDTFYGGGGKDKFYGGADDDTYYVDSSDDIVVDYAGEGYDTTVTTANFEMKGFGEALIMQGPGAVIGTGNDWHNDIFGSEADNTIMGMKGNDTLLGGAGNDTIDGGVGLDRLYGEADADTLTGGQHDDTFLFKQGGGHDIVTDFKAGGDLDVIETGLFANFGQIQDAMQQVGSDVVVTFDADTSFTLQNVDMASLQASDFHII